jgi:hypothetical protein
MKNFNKLSSDLDAITEAVMNDQEYFKKLINDGRVEDAMAIISAMCGKIEIGG